MLLGRFAIHLENADAVYFPGQLVKGVVHIWNADAIRAKGTVHSNDTYRLLKLNKHKQYEGIYAECRGQAKVHFTKEERGGRTSRQPDMTVHHKSTEDYFYHRVPLFDHGISLTINAL